MTEYELDANAQEIAALNIQQALENGPGLKYTTGFFVIAKDLENGGVLLGGLGAMGVGQMWWPLTEGCVTYPGFDTALDIDTRIVCAWLDYQDGKVKIRPRAESGEPLW